LSKKLVLSYHHTTCAAQKIPNDAPRQGLDMFLSKDVVGCCQIHYIICMYSTIGISCRPNPLTLPLTAITIRQGCSNKQREFKEKRGGDKSAPTEVGKGENIKGNLLPLEQKNGILSRKLPLEQMDWDEQDKNEEQEK
jgi:hypothetical protein